MKLGLAIALVCALALAACSSKPVSPGGAGGAQTSSFNQFPDVPIPETASMDVDNSLLVGGGENWVGRLVYNVRWTRGAAASLYDFYKSGMPTYNWQEITSVRAAISVQTWQRGARIATVQVRDTLLGAEVIITMSPIQGAGAPGPSSMSAPAQPPAPAAMPAPPSVSTQPLR